MRPLTKPYTLFPNPRALSLLATLASLNASGVSRRLAAARADGRFAAFIHVAVLSFEAYLFDTSCVSLESQHLAVLCPKRGVVAGRLQLREGHMAGPAAK